jgi:protein-glutamine gamma-glutamyltransferase
MNQVVPLESRGVALVKVVLLVYGTMMLAWPLTNGVTLGVTGAATFVAGLMARFCHRRGLRISATVAISICCLVLGLLLSYWTRNSAIVWGWLDARSTLLLSDCLLFGLGGAAFIFFLRLAAHRHHAWTIVEAAFVVSAVAHVFSRHRNLSFHRPRFLTDWALVNDIDPQLVLQSIGIMVSLLAMMMALRTQRGSKLIITMIALILIGVGVYHVGENVRIDAPIADFLAGDGQEKGDGESDGKSDGAEGEGEGGGQSGGSGQDSNSTPPLPVAVALLHGDYEPEHGLLYFRQQVLSLYNGTRLVADRGGQFDDDVIQSFPNQSVVKASPSQIEAYHLRVPTSMFLMIDHPQPFSLGSSVEVRPRPNPNPRRFVTAYDTVSLVPSAPVHRLTGRASVPKSWPQEKRDHYLAHPDDPRYAALAEEIVREVDLRYMGDPLVTALTIKRFLEAEGFYTRKERHAGTEDAAASFLFGSLRGYCVHFAHAAVHLFRSQGIAARVAVGYAVDTRMRSGGSAVLVMGDRAHAWPEIHLDGVGWIPFDIYPQQSDEPPPQIVSQSLESLLGEIARDDSSGGRKADPDSEAFVIPWFTIGRWILMIILGTLLLAYLIKLWRVITPTVRPGEHVKAFVSILDRFSDLGHARRYGETRERYARRLTELAPSFALLTETHLRLRLGQGSDEDIEAVPDLCKVVREEINTATPLWLRAAGWINPCGWWFTR